MYVKFCNLSLIRVSEKSRFQLFDWVEECFHIIWKSKSNRKFKSETKSRDMKDVYLVLTELVFLSYKGKWSWILFSETEWGKDSDWFGGDLKFLCLPPFWWLFLSKNSWKGPALCSFIERERKRGEEVERELKQVHSFVGIYTCRRVEKNRELIN